MCTSQIEQTVINKNVPTSQTIGESSKSQIEKPTCQIQAFPPTTNSDNSFYQNSSKTSLSHTDPNYLRKSTDTQNPTLQASKSTDEPKQFAAEISGGTEKETEGSGNNTLSGEQRTSPNLGTAIGVTQTISSPSGKWHCMCNCHFNLDDAILEIVLHVDFFAIYRNTENLGDFLCKDGCLVHVDV